MRKLAEYAVYKGEEFIDIGTAKELKERLKIPLKQVYWIASCRRFQKCKRHYKSYEIYRMEEDDDI